MWEQHCNTHVRQVGFMPVGEEWPSTYFHQGLQLLLVIYVDDLKLFGPEESHQRLGTVEAKLKIQDCQLPYNLMPLLPGRKQLKSNEVH